MNNVFKKKLFWTVPYSTLLENNTKPKHTQTLISGLSLLTYVWVIWVILDLYPTFFLNYICFKTDFKAELQCVFKFQSKPLLFSGLLLWYVLSLYFICTYILKYEMILFLTINPKTDIAIWQKFYNYCFAFRIIKVNVNKKS